MAKFMQFDMNVKNVFDNNENDYNAFNKLMLDYSHNALDGISVKEANQKIVEIFRNVIGCDEKSTKAEIRRGIRRNRSVWHFIRNLNRKDCSGINRFFHKFRREKADSEIMFNCRKNQIRSGKLD